MTRKLFVSALAATALTVGSAGIASAANLSYSTHDSGLGVIAPAMSTSSPASGPMAPGATNQGKTQMAAELETFPGLKNVDPTQYTPAELQNMLQAARAGDVSALNFYRSHTDRQPGGPGVGATNPGKSQIAAQLGLNPRAFTTAQLQRVQNDVRRGHLDDANYVVSQGTPAPAGIVVFVPATR